MDQTNTELMQPQGPKKNYRVSLLVVLVLIALVEFVLLMNKNTVPGAVTDSQQQNMKERKMEEVQKAGSFTVSTGSQKQFVVGQPVTVTITASSDKHSVVGFDAVMLFDASALTYRSVSSDLKGFTVVGSVRKGYLELTSAKDPAAEIVPVLNDTKVATVTFTPTKAGQYKLSLLDAIDQSSTKFVDSETVMYQPQLNEVSITVK